MRLYRFSPRFERSYAKILKRIASLLHKKLPLFLENPFHPSFRSKKMEGEKDPEIWEASLTIHYRWTFYIAEDGTLIFRNIGTHNILRRP